MAKDIDQDCRTACGSIGAVLAKPRAHRLMEVGVRVNDQPVPYAHRPRGIDPRLGASLAVRIHQLQERWAVQVGRPYLEALVTGRACVVVAREAIETTAKTVFGNVCAQFSQSSHQ